MTQTVLILGASGRFGRHAANAFSTAGWRIRRFNRGTDDLKTAMSDTDVVVSAWNPPGYHLWNDDLLAAHLAVAKAASRAGATVILPGNVYVFGPDAPTPWCEDTPHLATNPLGRCRQRIEAAYRDSGARVIVLRCGDFIDTAKTGNWFESYISADVAKGFIRYPGVSDAPHSWAFLPDAARASLALSEMREHLAGFNDVPFEGYTLTGDDLAKAIAMAVGRPISVRPFRWGLMRLLTPFVPAVAGVFEMRYLWSLPHRLDGTRLAELVPDFRPTPVGEALKLSLAQRSSTSLPIQA